MQYELGPLHIDTEQLAVIKDGVTLPLAPKVVEALVVLCERSGRFASKEELIERLWPGGYADDTTLWQKISLLRKFLSVHLGPNAIETLPRRGYRLAVATRTVANAPKPVPQAQATAPVRRRSTWAVLATVPMLAVITAAIIVVATPRQPAPSITLPEAQRAYNLGQHFLAMRTATSLDKAEEHFRIVISLQPKNALGYAGLADTYSLRADYGGASGNLVTRAALRYAHLAVNLDPDAAQAQTALGFAEFTSTLTSPRSASNHRAEVDAKRAFERALALDPSYAPARLWYGELLLARGDIKPAYEELARAVDLDPSLAIANVWLARAAYLMREPTAATTYAMEAIGFGTSDEEDALLTLGLAYTQTHNYAAALSSFRKMARYSRGLSAATAAYIEAKMGSTSRARADLEVALRDGGCRCGKLWINIALTQLALGERAQARNTFRRLADKEGRILATFDPRMDEPRNDPQLHNALPAPIAGP